MSYRNTRRVIKYAGIAWLCLLAFVIIVRATGLPLGRVQPEAVMLTFMMTLPFTVGVTFLAVSGTAIVERLADRQRSGANPAS